MSAERPVEPTLVQHVEGVRGELRTEQRSLEELLVRNVPEPERLAEWLRAQRDTEHK